jgi:hypothetical protein
MISSFLMGAISMGFGVASLCFLRYWRESRDRLFAWFSAAFLVLAVNRAMPVFLHEPREATLLPYLVRLAAFLVILAAILDKNFHRA